jgi:HprK-related kinase A
MLEWGMNWCIANHAHHFLILHSAVLEKNGKSVVLPAPQGSGKSTLCAALAGKGWRLLSDELALISLKTGELHPCTKPINLKNDSINIIKSFLPDSVNSNLFKDTHKGTVSLFKPNEHSSSRSWQACSPDFVIFPRYIKDSSTELKPMHQSEAFIQLIENSFNYDVLGADGFEAMCAFTDKVDFYQFSYSSLDDAIAVFDNVINE